MTLEPIDTYISHIHIELQVLLFNLIRHFSRTCSRSPSGVPRGITPLD